MNNNTDIYEIIKFRCLLQKINIHTLFENSERFLEFINLNPDIFLMWLKINNKINQIRC
jgi:hypothetical protein